MIRKCVFIFLVYIYQIIYADNSVGSIGSIENPSTKNMNGLSAQALDVKYTVYNYRMKQAEFAKFLEKNKLHKSTNLATSTNIVLLTVLQKEEFDTLNQKLTKEFTNKFAGGSRCIVSNDLCAGGSSTGVTTDINAGRRPTVDKASIFFKVFTDKTELSAKVISDNIINDQVHTVDLVSLKYEIVLKDIKNKNYVLISQISKNGILYGQIMQISFSNSRGYTKNKNNH